MNKNEAKWLLDQNISVDVRLVPIRNVHRVISIHIPFMHEFSALNCVWKCRSWFYQSFSIIPKSSTVIQKCMHTH